LVSFRGEGDGACYTYMCIRLMTHGSKLRGLVDSNVCLWFRRPPTRIREMDPIGEPVQPVEVELMSDTAPIKIMILTCALIMAFGKFVGIE
jgi:hypothetical protein